MRESLRGPFKKTSEFLAAFFFFTWMDEISAGFHSQMLWGPLLPALVLWGGELV